MNPKILFPVAHRDAIEVPPPLHFLYFKLKIESSVFSCEAFALLQVLIYCSQSEYKQIASFSVSKNILESLKKSGLSSDMRAIVASIWACLIVSPFE